MRLIDADALLEELRKSCKWHAESSRELSLLQRDINIVKEQPTVDAVPLEWIKRRIEGLNIQAENSTDDNKWAEFVREAFALEKIVKFWAERKEE